MKSTRRFSLPALVSLLFFCAISFTQTVFAGTVFTVAHPTQRVKRQVNDGERTVLYGHVPQVITHGVRTGAAIDLGRIDPKTPMQSMRMVLRSSPDQTKELRRILDEQQDLRTANFHQWMTPEDFGKSFGVHDRDIKQVKNWLASQGFTVENVTKSKRIIQFSGTAGHVERAFQTQMHAYIVNGENHISAGNEISVPAALAPVISGVHGLHNFFPKSHLVGAHTLADEELARGGRASQASQPSGGQQSGQTSGERHGNVKPGPKYSSGTGTHYVGPADFATIYNTKPLLQAGIDGTGQTIAVVGRSDILLSDVQTYRQLFNLPPNDPIFIHAGQDNGTEGGDDGESDLDVEIPGGIAPGATIKFVIGTPTFNVDGITNSIEYIVENNIADIMSISYGSCEDVEGVGGNQFNNAIFEQAAAQGISTFVASGDNGPAGCDNQNDNYEVMGYATDSEGSTPYVVSVGGTEFYPDASGASTYWGTNGVNDIYLGSALTYIPEYPWNESRVASPAPTGESGSSLSGLWSASGGISAYYLRPAWQQGPGITNGSDPALTLGNGATGLWVADVNITSGGSGYTSAPTVTFSGGGCADQASAAAVVSGGAVVGLTFNGYTAHYRGFGCTSAPTIAFSGGGGTGAAATAITGQMQTPAYLVTGVPHRMTPDISLNASSGHDPTFFCSEGVCQISSAGALLNAGLVGGTSVAAPSMAGVQALINQANGGRQGMPGYIYYTLAANQNTANCNSSLPPAPGSNCAFQDVTLGNNLICGRSGSGCSATLTQAKIGFNAGIGYDMASGLGSPNAANLATQWQSVVFNSTTTTLNLSQTSGNHGDSIALSGTVSGTGGTPTGDVAFIVSQGTIGWPADPGTGAPAGTPAFATLSGGSYSVNLNNLPAGTYDVTARYGGDGTYASSMSAPVQVTITSENSVITITPQILNQTACTITSGSTFNYGDLVWVEVQVNGNSGFGVGVPTGTVTITDNAVAIATLTLDPQGKGYLVAGSIPTSSCIAGYIFSQSPTLSGGVHNIGASYSGDATFNANTGTPVAVTINPLTPTVTLAAGGTLISSGYADTLTATLGGFTTLNGYTSTSSGPTGTVTFTDTTTSTVLGTANVVPTVSFSGNVYTYGATAQLTTTGITVSGANSITATYNGDSNYNTNTSSAVTVTVGTGTSTSTAVTSSANPTTLNGRPTFTATITGGTGPTAGTVTFYDGTSVLGTGTVGTAHTATFRPASGAAFFGGAHNITAAFGGNATFLASTSPVFVETVTQGTVTIALTAKTVGNSNQNYTFAAVLTPSQTNATYAPNQSVVNFYDGATNIGSAKPLTITSGQGGYGLWTATITVNNLTAGTHTITATYTDINYSLGTSNAQTVYVGNGTSNIGIYSPVNGSTLTSTSATFRWFPVPGANYWLDIGSNQGGNQYYQSGNLGAGVLSKAVAGLPSDGSTIWARLWYQLNGTWNFADNTYTAYNPNANKGVITSPVPGSTLPGSSVNFTWNPGLGASAYWIDAGSTPGGNQYWQSGNLGNVTSAVVSNLPTDGSTVYVTLYSFVGGQWLNNQYTYTAFNLAGSQGVITSPVPNSQFTDTTVTFTWTAGGGATAYWLDVGSSPGGNQYWQSGNLGNVLTTTVSGLPNDGSTVYVTLYSYVAGQWLGTTYTYTAFNLAGALGVMQTPTPGSTLSGTVATFTWSAGTGATDYWLDVGSSPGGNQYWQSGSLGLVLTTTVSTLPADGSTIYVTLWSYVGGQWLNNQYTYISGP